MSGTTPTPFPSLYASGGYHLRRWQLTRAPYYDPATFDPEDPELGRLQVYILSDDVSPDGLHSLHNENGLVTETRFVPATTTVEGHLVAVGQGKGTLKVIYPDGTHTVTTFDKRQVTKVTVFGPGDRAAVLGEHMTEQFDPFGDRTSYTHWVAAQRLGSTQVAASARSVTVTSAGPQGPGRSTAAKDFDKFGTPQRITRPDGFEFERFVLGERGAVGWPADLRPSGRDRMQLARLLRELHGTAGNLTVQVALGPWRFDRRVMAADSPRAFSGPLASVGSGLGTLALAACDSLPPGTEVNVFMDLREPLERSEANAAAPRRATATTRTGGNGDARIYDAGRLRLGAPGPRMATVFVARGGHRDSEWLCRMDSTGSITPQRTPAAPQGVADGSVALTRWLEATMPAVPTMLPTGATDSEGTANGTPATAAAAPATRPAAGQPGSGPSYAIWVHIDDEEKTTMEALARGLAPLQIAAARALPEDATLTIFIVLDSLDKALAALAPAPAPRP